MLADFRFLSLDNLKCECSVHFTAEQIELRVCNSNKEEKVFQSIVSRCYEEIQTMIRSHLNVRLEDMKRRCTVTFSKDVFSQGAVNWVFLGLFH